MLYTQSCNKLYSASLIYFLWLDLLKYRSNTLLSSVTPLCLGDTPRQTPSLLPLGYVIYKESKNVLWFLLGKRREELEKLTVDFGVKEEFEMCQLLSIFPRKYNVWKIIKMLKSSVSGINVSKIKIEFEKIL